MNVCSHGRTERVQSFALLKGDSSWISIQYNPMIFPYSYALSLAILFTWCILFLLLRNPSLPWLQILLCFPFGVAWFSPAEPMPRYIAAQQNVDASRNRVQADTRYAILLRFLASLKFPFVHRAFPYCVKRILQMSSAYISSSATRCSFRTGFRRVRFRCRSKGSEQVLQGWFR